MALAIALAGLAGCAANPDANSTSAEPAGADAAFAGERAAIRALRVANNQAIAARDLERTMAISAEDYVLVAGSDSIISGREAMRARWSESFADPNARGCLRRTRNIEIGERSGVLRAAESGTWQCPRETPAGEAVAFGSYFAHWSKRSGDWRVVSDNYVTLGCRGTGC